MPISGHVHVPLTLFSDAILKLRRLFKMDALTDWTLWAMSSLLSYTVLHYVTKGLISNYIYYTLC